jgi:hypothetical protein
MGSPINILLQRTIPAIADDWNIDRLSLLRDYRVSFTDEEVSSCFHRDPEIAPR